MKDQYAGDQNDYVKFGLLRALCGAELSPFIAWMHTPDDLKTDGRRLGYLEQPETWRAHDPHLFDALQTVVKKKERTVAALEKAVPLPAAKFSHAEVPDDAAPRERWLHDLLLMAEEHELVFFDPDNGLEVPSTPTGSPGSSKFLSWEEVETTAQRGHSVLVYQHYRRVNRQALAASLLEELSARTGCHDTLGFHSAHVLFLLAVAKPHARALRQGIAEVEARWSPRLTVQRLEAAANAPKARAQPKR